MKKYNFQDLHGVEVTVQHSSLATQEAYRVYLDGESFPKEKDNLGNEIPVCLHINRNQATILIAALQDLMGDE